jgi:hypothetical protein
VLDIVEGSAPSKTEKETASGAGAGARNVETPAPPGEKETDRTYRVPLGTSAHKEGA